MRSSWISAAAAGALVGAIEGLLLSLLSRVPGGPLDAVFVALIDASLGAGLGAAVGAGLALLTRRQDVVVGLTVAAVSAAVLAWPVLGLARDGRHPLALASVAIAVCGAGAAMSGARLFEHRARERAPLAAAFAGPALALILASGPARLAASPRASGAARPSVLVITVDTLRRDAVGAYAGTGVTPNLDALGASGVLFLDAVTPMPETAPAHASMFTGLHPLRHRVVSNGHHLAPGFSTVAETLSGDGYATAAFTSSYAVDARTGLDAGFAVYDDDLPPGPGLSRLGLARLFTWAWMARGLPATTPWLVERSGSDTVDAFADWLSEQGEAPFFAWVHLFEPHAPYEPHQPGDPTLLHRDHLGPDAAFTDAQRADLRRLYASEVTEADRQIGRALERLEASGVRERTLVIVAGDHGEMLGEHGVDFTHTGLFEEVVRVPLILAGPRLEASVQRVDAQVRLTDVAATILAWTGVTPRAETEGVSLLDYASGKRARSLGTALIGRKARSFSEGALIGARNNGTKYVRDLATGDESLFLVSSDPSESHDLKATSPDDLARARGLVDPDAETLRALVGVPALGQAAMLEALGYQQ